MKKTLFIIVLCAVLLSMPSLLAFTTTNEPSILKMSDGTLVGGLGRGHWENGFHIDAVDAYINGVYTSGSYIRISGEITNQYNEKIGEISVFMFSKFIFGYTKNMDGQRSPIIAILNENQNNHFVGRVMFNTFRPATHIWGYLIPNK